MNKERIIIIVLLILLFWFGAAIARLENYRYAAQIGLCAKEDPAEIWPCLEKTQTRTSSFFHLLYGLRIL